VSELDVLLSVALGIGLAAAVGLRVFLPLFVMSIAAHSGYLDLSAQFEWLGTLPAMVMLGVAALLEVFAYYFPGIDNLLDAVATPAAVLAGTVAAAAVTALLRAKSTATTGGLGNPLIATGELGGSLLVSVLAIAAPLVAIAITVLFVWLVMRLVRRLFRRKPPAAHPPSTPPSPGAGEGVG
jgi:uncharacterized membrane protein